MIGIEYYWHYHYRNLDCTFVIINYSVAVINDVCFDSYWSIVGTSDLSTFTFAGYKMVKLSSVTREHYTSMATDYYIHIGYSHVANGIEYYCNFAFTSCFIAITFIGYLSRPSCIYLDHY